MQGFERTHQHGLARLLPARREVGVERVQGQRTDAAVRSQIGIVLGIAVERRQRALEEGRRDRGAHVDASVEQLRRDPLGPLGDLVEPRPQPIEPPIDRRRLMPRQAPRRAGISVRPRDGLRNAEAGRPALVGGMVHITALALDQFVDQPVDVEISIVQNSLHRNYNRVEVCANLFGCL